MFQTRKPLEQQKIERSQHIYLVSRHYWFVVIILSEVRGDPVILTLCLFVNFELLHALETVVRHIITIIYRTCSRLNWCNYILF